MQLDVDAWHLLKEVECLGELPVRPSGNECCSLDIMRCSMRFDCVCVRQARPLQPVARRAG